MRPVAGPAAHPGGLLLLHGASGNAATWAPVLPHLAGLAPWALDLPGRGATPGPALDTVADLARWLSGRLSDRLSDRLSGRLADTPSGPVCLVGHSLGGAVGLQLALDHPGTLSGLVLVASAARLRVHPAILEAVRGATRDQPFRLDAAFGPTTPQDLVESYARATATTPPETSLADWLACDGFDLRDRLRRLELPVLVVHGDQDLFTPPRFQGALAEALGAQRQELPGVGHMLPWEAPEALAQVLRRWLPQR